MSPAKMAKPEHGALHLAKAEEFLEGAVLAVEAGKADVAVTVAVIAAIRASDAICAVRLGRRWAGADYAGAVDLLNTAHPEGETGAPLLLAVLPAKNQAQYGLVDFSEPDAEALLEKARELVDLAQTAVAGEPVPHHASERADAAEADAEAEASGVAPDRG